MNENQTPVCPHCGALMKEWEHTLTPGLVNILVKAIIQVKKTGTNRFYATADLGLTHNEAANFQKLRFHALVAHANPNNRHNGEWLLTDRAGKFLRGEINVPARVKTYRNKVIGYSEEMVKMADFRGNVPTCFQDKFDWQIHKGKLIYLTSE